MDREEAIKTIKLCCPNIRRSDCDFETAMRFLIPELAESEDEMHRKWILEYLYDGLRKADEQFKDHFKSAIDWLEKQKEQKPAEYEPHNWSTDKNNLVQSPVECKDCAMFLGGKCERPDGICKKEQKSLTEQEFCDYNKALHKFKVFATKQAKEHNICYIKNVEWDNFCVGIFSYFYKPAEWSEEDEKMLRTIISDGSRGVELDSKQISFLKSLRPQPKQEWSEDDEEMLDAMIDIVSNSLYEPLCPRNGMLAWLKSLPERFNLQPKQEWNDGINILEDIIVFVSGYADKRVVTKWVSFLKSLRPSWRPSEHQMTILKAVKEYVGRGSGYWGEALGSLIKDLEKL